MELTTVKSITTQFKWKTKTGDFISPRDMATSHIFFTLRMIWNHSVPEEYKLTPYRRYNFGSFYTNEYMTSAVRALAVELLTRKDLSPNLKLQLDKIVESVKSIQLFTYHNISIEGPDEN